MTKKERDERRAAENAAMCKLIALVKEQCEAEAQRDHELDIKYADAPMLSAPVWRVHGH